MNLTREKEKRLWRDRDRKTERQRDRDTEKKEEDGLERQRKRQRDRETETETGAKAKKRLLRDRNRMWKLSILMPLPPLSFPLLLPFYCSSTSSYLILQIGNGQPLPHS